MRDSRTKLIGMQRSRSSKEHLPLEREDIADDFSFTQNSAADDCSHKNNFFADSPYFDAFVDKEMNSLRLVADFVKKMVTETSKVSETGHQLAKATQRLAKLCQMRSVCISDPGDANSAICDEDEIGKQDEKLEQIKTALGQDTYELLNCLGMALENIAETQEKLFASIQTAVESQLKQNVVRAVNTGGNLKEESDTQTMKTEQLLYKYLSTSTSEHTVGQAVRRNSSGGSLSRILRRNSSGSSLNRGIGRNYSGSSLDIARRSIGSLQHEEKAAEVTTSNPLQGARQNSSWKSFSRIVRKQRSTDEDEMSNSSHHSNCMRQNEEILDCQNGADLSKQQSVVCKIKKFDKNVITRSHSMRQSNSIRFSLSAPLLVKAKKLATCRVTLHQLQANQATANWKRFELSRHFVDTKYQRNLELSEFTGILLRGIEKYSQQCLAVTKDAIPNADQKQEEYAQSQYTHKNNGRWQKAQESLLDIMLERESAVMDAQNEMNDEKKMCDPFMVNPKTLNLDFVEQDVKVWELPNKLAAAARCQRKTEQNVCMQGWLYQRKLTPKVSGQHWVRRWFLLKSGELFILRSCAETNIETHHSTAVSDTSAKIKVCDVLLCTVLELAEEEVDGRFQFQLHILNQEPITFMARGKEEYHMWVNGIRDAIANEFAESDLRSKKLNEGIGEGYKRQSSEIALATSKSTRSIFQSIGSDEMLISKDDQDIADKNSNITIEPGKDPASETKSENGERNCIIKQLMKANPTCADCGRMSPDWVSLNLGILVCIDFSGVHRSLGVHISKVRSLVLDSLSDREAWLLSSLGNDRLNAIWQRSIMIQPSREKKLLHSRAERSVREEWIRNKYVGEKFLSSSPDNDSSSNIFCTENVEEMSYEIVKAARQGNVVGIARALAFGGDANFTNNNKDNSMNTEQTEIGICCDDHTGTITALRAVVDGWKIHEDRQRALNCVELLLQNGAKICSEDRTELAILDHEYANVE